MRTEQETVVSHICFIRCWVPPGDCVGQRVLHMCQAGSSFFTKLLTIYPALGILIVSQQVIGQRRACAPDVWPLLPCQAAMTLQFVHN